MTTYELYFLILVCSAFVVLGIALATATFVYRRSFRRDPARPVRSAKTMNFGGTMSRS